MLLDLLSIGDPPAQSGSSALDIIPSSLDNNSSVDLLGKVATTSTPAVASTRAGTMMDLLDGFGANPSVPGMYQHFISAFVNIFLVNFSHNASNSCSDQWHNLSIDCCIREQLPKSNFQLLKGACQPAEHTNRGSIYEQVTQYLLKFRVPGCGSQGNLRMPSS